MSNQALRGYVDRDSAAAWRGAPELARRIAAAGRRGLIRLAQALERSNRRRAEETIRRCRMNRNPQVMRWLERRYGLDGPEHGGTLP